MGGIGASAPRALLCVLLAAGVLVAVPGSDSLRTGLALFALIGSLWMTQALHLSATALLVPVFLVVGDALGLPGPLLAGAIAAAALLAFG